ncbi:MAG: hypothetical protein WBC59_07345 [Phycisphaerae bacterium]
MLKRGVRRLQQPFGLAPTKPVLHDDLAAAPACREVVNLPTHPRATPRTARRAVEFVTAIGPPLSP